MSLAAVPAYLSRAACCRRAVAVRGGPRGRASLARLHRRGDDRERLLPALPHAALTLVLALERPTLAAPAPPARGCCVVALLTRAQALAFFPAASTAPLLLVAGRPWRCVLGCCCTACRSAAPCSSSRAARARRVAVSACSARTRSSATTRTNRGRAAGGSSTTSPSSTSTSACSRSRHCSAPRLSRSLREACAAVPRRGAIALDVYAARRSPRSRRSRGAIEERNIFYSRAAATDRAARLGRPGRAAAALTAGAAACSRRLLPAVIPYERLIGGRASDTLDDPAALARAATWSSSTRSTTSSYRRARSRRCCSCSSRGGSCRAPRRRARLLRDRDPPIGGTARDGAARRRGALRGDSRPAARVDRPGRRATGRRRRALDRQDESLHRS